MGPGESGGERPRLLYLDGTNDPAPRQLGPYRVFARFAGSGMSDVYLGKKSSPFGFVRLAVIKHLPRSSHQFDLKRQMLFDEARALAYLDHPNLVTILDADEDATGVYLCLEYVDGVDLRSVNAALRARGEALPFELAGFIAVEILRGLHHAHGAERPDGTSLRIVHRDVNPANILIARTGHLKLTDFGVVHMQDRLQAPTEPGLVKGKFAYLAPEYIQGRPVDARMDIYGAGVVLFELLTGRSLFSGESAHDIMRKIVAHDVRLDRLEREGVPEPVRSIVERALALEPSYRYATAEDMANALETWLIRSELHASPWILAAFFRQHQLFGPPVRVSAPAATLGHAGIPSATTPAETPGTRPFATWTDSAPTPFHDDEVATLPEAKRPSPAVTPMVETLEPVTSPGTRIPPQATVRTGPPSFTPVAPPKPPLASHPPSIASAPQPPRVFPSFSQPPLRGPESIPSGATIPDAGTHSSRPPSVRPASRPPIAPRASSPDLALDFDANEPTERGAPMSSSLPPFMPVAAPVPPSAPPAPASTAPHSPPSRAPSVAPSRIGPGPAHGDFNEAAPAVVLSRLVSSRATGRLEFRSGLIWKRVDLHEGQVLNVSSNMGMEDLGEQLVRSKAVKRADLDRALRESRGSEVAAWHRLIEIEAVSRDALANQLGASITATLEDVLGWEEGSFDFVPGRPEMPPVLPNVDLARLLTRRGGSSSGPPRPSAPAPAASDDSHHDGLPPRKRPSLAEALGLARQAQEGPGGGRGSAPPDRS